MESLDHEFPQLLAPASEAEREQHWLAERRQLITGTDVAALLLPPDQRGFRSPVEVWLDKRGESHSDSGSERLEFGREFQAPILNVYGRRLGRRVRHCDPFTVTRVPDFPLLGASLDARWVDDDERPVDAKNVERRSEKWGEPGTADFPLYYQLQLAVQMMATETQAADLAVCFGGCSLAIYTLHRDPEIDAVLRDEVSRWWRRHIVDGHEPEPEASDAYSSYLARRFAKHSERVLSCDGFVEGWAKRLAAARELEAQAAAERLLCENAIKAAMGDANSVEGVCSWRNNRPSVVVDYAAAFKGLAATVSPEIAQALIAANTTTKPGARVFRFNPKGLLTNGND